jgi:enoyl-CoA hydratase
LLGLATGFVEASRLEALKARIIATPPQLEDILAELASDPGPAPLAANLDVLNRTFDGASVEEVLAALQAEASDWAATQAEAIKAKSPTLLKVACRQLRQGARMANFADNMAMEFRIASRVIFDHDFAEGVRAVVIDKDGAPRWRPASLDEVTPATIDAIFAPLAPELEWRPIRL